MRCSLILVSNNLNLIYMLHLWRPLLVNCPSWDWLGMLLLASWCRKFQMTLFCSWITWSCCRISEISSFRAWSIPAKNFRKPSDSMVLFLGTDEDNWIFQCLATVFLHPFFISWKTIQHIKLTRTATSVLISRGVHTPQFTSCCSDYGWYISCTFSSFFACCGVIRLRVCLLTVLIFGV